MADKIGMIGAGNVGTALTNGLTRAGHEVRASGNEPAKVKEIGQWADVIFLAVPYAARQEAIRNLGEIGGKTLVDVTNTLGPTGDIAIDPASESGAEQVQTMASNSHVVKAFNTVFAQHMDKGHVHGEKLTVLLASDDASAKKRVSKLAREIGFDAVDAGPLKNARWLETLGFLNIQLGYGLGMGPAMGFKLVHEGNRVSPPRAEQRPMDTAR